MTMEPTTNPGNGGFAGLSSGNSREATEGEYRVGIGFNPSADPLVGEIKRKAADLIDLIAPLTDPTRGHPASARCAAIALTEIESAAMWAVKAATKPKR
jgi:hypothetical protein